MKIWSKPFLPILALVLATTVFALAKSGSQSSIFEELSRLNTILSQIDQNYVEEVDPADISDAALNGIRDVLDPHTAVFSPDDYSDMKVQTKGEFGGLGITIAVREQVLTIITPLQGTPAFRMGLQAGDKIIKIEGESTKGITVEDAVDKLRGKVGTDVTISIAREGEVDLIDYTVTRGRIVIHAVPYYGMLNEDVGYIKITKFSEKTANDIQKAIQGLKEEGMKKLVLDFRFNPGGLLQQAIAVSEMFLKKGNLIVSTRGRTQETETHSQQDGIVPSDIPIVALVNEGSASASEIVTGALQDWDRAVILGKNSFGKGSVQSIIPISNDGYALKMTVAFYYLPKGRCVNKPENGIRGKEELPEDSLAQDSVAIFHTENGRPMRDAGGIAPDVEVDLNPMPWLAQVLERRNMFFKFVIKKRPEWEKAGISIDKNFSVSDEIIDEFHDYLKADSAFSALESVPEQTVAVLDSVLLREQEMTGDTTKVLKDAEVIAALAQLRTSLANARTKKFSQNRDYIRRALKREILTAVLGEKERIAYTLTYDPQVEAAIEVLNDRKRYNEILNIKDDLH
jgi:carboxyl-terminal processing protease